MIKTLIADDNLSYAKNIINNIISKITDIKLEYVCTNGKETLDAISKKPFDLIFLDLQLPKLNGLEILKEINRLNSVKKPKVIIISGDMPLIEQIKSYDNICNIILKTESNDVICRKIEEVVNDMKYELTYSTVKLKVVSELTEMGYNFKYVGTKYILESIMYIYENNTFDLLDNLEKNVYKIVSYNNHKTLENVKTNIIKSTKLRHRNNEKITPKSVITQILIKIYDES